MRGLLVLALVACGGSKDDDPPEDTSGDGGPTVTTPAGTSTDPTPFTPPREWCLPLELSATRTLTPSDDVQAALDAAAPGDVLALSAGTYALDIAPWTLGTNGVSLVGATGDADDVVVDGAFGPSDLLVIEAPDVTVAHITFKRSFFRGIRVTPPEGVAVDGVRIYGVVVEDPGAEAVRVESDATGRFYADDGEVACSSLRVTDIGRDRQRIACAVSGVHLERTRGWTVNDNIVEGFWCPEHPSAPAIFVGDGARDTVVERNQVRDSAIGIQLGLGEGGGRRMWDDAPCLEGGAQHYDGVVRNNTVVVIDRGLVGSADGFLAGVALQSACGSSVLHNTVYSDDQPGGAAIEFSHATTTGIVVNNLTNHGLARRDGSPMVNEFNTENFDAIWFLYTPDWDVHLNPGTPEGQALDDGTDAYLELCPEDMDGQLRDERPDVGADELRF